VAVSFNGGRTGMTPTIRPFTSGIAEEVMDFEYEKYKCRVLLRLVGTVEGFHWFQETFIIIDMILSKHNFTKNK
jgi:hypothetical protein